MALPRIAIALGDPAGIGPEIALKAALDADVRRLCRPLLVGDRRVVDAHARRCGLAPLIKGYRQAAAIDPAAEGLAMLELDQFSNVVNRSLWARFAPRTAGLPAMRRRRQSRLRSILPGRTSPALRR